MSFEQSNERLKLAAYADGTEEFRSILLEKGGVGLLETSKLVGCWYYRSMKTGRSIAVSASESKTWMLSAEHQRRLSKSEVREMLKLCVGKVTVVQPKSRWLASKEGTNDYHLFVFDGGNNPGQAVN
jgi:hypothetical protein